MTEDNREIITSRRTFLGQAIAVSAVALTSSRIYAQPSRLKPAQANPMAPTSTPVSVAAPATGGLGLPPLPYAQNALEPYISATTISYHYGKHHRAYFEKTNSLIQGTPLAGKTLEQIVQSSAKSKSLLKLFNSAAQTWNHNFYGQSMKVGGGGAPTGAIAERVAKDFGSYDAFKTQFIQIGVDHFSNGWVWLVLDKGKLKIVDTHDADTPVAHGKKPLLVTDVWEHAYYLDYKNARKDYITGVVEHLLNWDFAAGNLG